jgi:hypothetical protein
MDERMKLSRVDSKNDHAKGRALKMMVVIKQKYRSSGLGSSLYSRSGK